MTSTFLTGIIDYYNVHADSNSNECVEILNVAQNFLKNLEICPGGGDCTEHL